MQLPSLVLTLSLFSFLMSRWAGYHYQHHNMAPRIRSVPPQSVATIIIPDPRRLFLLLTITGLSLSPLIAVIVFWIRDVLRRTQCPGAAAARGASVLTPAPELCPGDMALLSSPTASSVKELQLPVQISREGDSTMKAFKLSRSTSFSDTISEVIKRYHYQDSSDFDMYSVTKGGDRVDVDMDSDFQDLTTPYWEKLDYLEAKGTPECERRVLLRLHIKDSATYRQRQYGLSTDSNSTSELHGRPFFHQAMKVPVKSAGDGTPRIQWHNMGAIGKGGFGMVYEGTTSDGRIVAVKVQEMLSSEEVSDANRVVEEIELMRHLQHRNIVSYYGCQTTPLESGAVMMEIFLEMCHGGTLSGVRKRFAKEKQCIPIPLVRTYVKGVLEGLKYLHGNQIVHRDLKPDNVLIASDGTVKLGDFGCSKLIETTLCHTSAGTPMYMAPEVINAWTSDEGYSTSADIWSLGCIVLELLGRQPWRTQLTNREQLIFHIGRSTGLPTGMPANCPPALYDFLSHCLERDAGSRWTAEQLLQHEWMTCPDAELEGLPAADGSIPSTIPVSVYR